MPRLPAIKARIVAIGSSQGIRIPKPLLEQAGLAGDVELHGEDLLIDTPALAFDAEEWK